MRFRYGLILTWALHPCWQPSCPGASSPYATACFRVGILEPGECRELYNLMVDFQIGGDVGLVATKTRPPSPSTYVLGMRGKPQREASA